MKRIACIIILVCAAFIVNAQSVSSSVVATAGNSVETANVKVSWTVGEVAVETIGQKGSTPILTQGFQQGYFEVTSIGDELDSEFKVNVYPNPVIDFLWVDVKSLKAKEAVIEIYSMDGKLIYNQDFELTNGAQQISVSELTSSQYILRITEPTGEVIRTFKLIKR